VRTASKHRLAMQPPCGDPDSGKKQTMCGVYARPDAYTINPEEVNCGTCVNGRTAKRRPALILR
jgi:hypothetical protein